MGACLKHGEISVGLIYPNSYFTGMSNLGFQTVYGQLNRIRDVSCQRIFLSEFPRSLERETLLSDFQILAFSISFELDYLNVLRILHSAGIPLRSAQRGQVHPLIIAGGFASSVNPEPLAEFVDIFLIGEGEELLDDFINSYKALRKELGRVELLRELAQIEGVYIPSLKEKRAVKRRWLENLDDFDTASSVVTPNTAFGDMFMIELTRGCPRRCLFCLAGSVCKPFRSRSFEKVLRLAGKGLRIRNRVGLVSLEIASYPYLDEVVTGIFDMGGTVSLSSLRPGRAGDGVIRALKGSGQKTIAIAPEAGSERLRRIINKDIHDEEIFAQIEAVTAAGVEHIRLYFLIGLPTETDSDIEALLEFVINVRKIAGRFSRRSPRITVSVNPFVPKPATPFQWARMEKGNVLSSRLKMISKEFDKVGGIDLIHESVRRSLFQGVLARGDRKVGRVIEKASETGDWRKAFREVGVDPAFYLERERAEEEIFPWDRIIQGCDKHLLYGAYKKAISIPDSLCKIDGRISGLSLL